MRRSPSRIKLVLLALILPCLYSMFVVFMKWLPHDQDFFGRDILSQYEMRLAPVKPALAGVEALRYLGDHSVPSDADAQRNFQITQYVLAPILLTDKRPSPYAISVKPLDAYQEQQIREQGLVLFMDFGNGVRLYKQGAP